MGTLLKIFPHLTLERFQAVGGGADFDDEVGTEVPEGMTFFRSELGDAGFLGPGGVGGAAGAFEEDEAGGGSQRPGRLSFPSFPIG